MCKLTLANRGSSIYRQSPIFSLVTNTQLSSLNANIELFLNSETRLSYSPKFVCKTKCFSRGWNLAKLFWNSWSLFAHYLVKQLFLFNYVRVQAPQSSSSFLNIWAKKGETILLGFEIGLGLKLRGCLAIKLLPRTTFKHFFQWQLNSLAHLNPGQMKRHFL